MIAIVGAGSWGTALAEIAAQNNAGTVLWGRNPEQMREIAATRINNKYLPTLKLSKEIEITADLTKVAAAEVIIVAVPSAYMRDTARKLAKLNLNGRIIVSCTKGLEAETFLRMSEVLRAELPGNTVAVLSGPNHAESVSGGDPTATVIACEDPSAVLYLQKVLSGKNFRPYTSTDVLGVELAGAFKNIIALAGGVLAGLGYGDNTAAALMTRGIVEIARLGIKMGAEQSTFWGLAGIGDLIVTCVSRHSRNRRAGEALGRGQSLNEILQGSDMVIEGVKTTKIAKQLAEQYQVEMPITEKLFQILYEDKEPQIAIAELMKRDYGEDGL